MAWRNITVMSCSKKGIYFKNSYAVAVGIQIKIMGHWKHNSILFWHVKQTEIITHKLYIPLFDSKCTPKYHWSKTSGGYKWEWFWYTTETEWDSLAKLSVLLAWNQVCSQNWKQQYFTFFLLLLGMSRILSSFFSYTKHFIKWLQNGIQK